VKSTPGEATIENRKHRSDLRPERSIMHRAIRENLCVALAGALVGLLAGCAGPKATVNEPISIVIPERSHPALRIAADDLAGYLGKIYPDERFVVSPGQRSPERTIFLATAADIEALYLQAKPELPTAPDGYAVTPVTAGDRQSLCIVGANERGVLYGVYALLEKLGYGFYLSFETLPKPRRGCVDFSTWTLADAPLSQERIVFNWHNFLTGCSGWDKRDWLNWIRQSQKMGFNTIMVHAYGNNPMFTFEFNGEVKPVGYLPHSGKGRDWSNSNINDVRRMPSGDVIADSPFFGSEAALVPDDQRVAAVQTMMRGVFQEAANRDMGVNFAIDFDSPAANPPELVLTLPKADRFKGGNLWLPRPDTEGGYAFYKAELAGLLKLYPQITTVTLWHRANTAWSLKAEQFPGNWQEEFDAACTRIPQLKELGREGSAHFAIAKVVAACRRALRELGRDDVRLTYGSWYQNNFDWVEAAVLALPDEVQILPLDYSVLTGQSMLLHDDKLENLRSCARGRVVPIIWAQHDDGGYMGRPIAMIPELQTRLEKIGAPGVGIIHWMNRPYDNFFKSHSRQVWESTRDELLGVTCSRMAADCFGEANREWLGEYLRLFTTEAPCVGRATQETFFYHGWNEGVKNAPELIRLGRERLAMLDCAKTSVMNANQKRWLGYFRAFETFLVHFCDTQDRVQQANALIVAGRHAEAVPVLNALKPEEVIAEYARMVRLMPDDKGQRGMVLRLGYAWLGEIVCLRQMAGMEPVRYAFGPTIPEPLAEGGTYYNDFFDRDGKLWRLLGEYEILDAPFGPHQMRLPPANPKRITIYTFPSNVIVRLEDKTPEAWRELGGNGVIFRQTVPIPLRAINKGFKYSFDRGELRPGCYTLTLLASRKTPGNATCAANVRIAPLATTNAAAGKPAVIECRMDLPPEKSSGAVTLHTLAIPMQLTLSGNATLEIVPEEGEVIVSGVVLSFKSSLSGP